MPIYLLNETLKFPHPSEAEDGILAVGGDLSPERILLAYQEGIFPWYSEDDPILWWSPDPRCVLYPEELKVSKSMRKILKDNIFEVTINTCFEKVILACANTPRKNQKGTWIDENIKKAYSQLHHDGFAHSIEVWKDNELVGGLYGIWLGNVFFGESMFSLLPNASKVGLITWVQYLQNEGVKLIDCQIYTPHLESLGASLISRNDYLIALSLHLQ